MENLHIESTNNTPEVTLDLGKKGLLISGKCLPENANLLFDTLNGWIDEYVKTYDTLTVACKLEYINSASNKLLYQFIQKCICEIKNIKIVWMYSVDDDDMKEQGVDFQEAMKIKFEFKILM